MQVASHPRGGAQWRELVRVSCLQEIGKIRGKLHQLPVLARNLCKLPLFAKPIGATTLSAAWWKPGTATRHPWAWASFLLDSFPLQGLASVTASAVAPRLPALSTTPLTRRLRSRLTKVTSPSWSSLSSSSSCSAFFHVCVYSPLLASSYTLRKCSLRTTAVRRRGGARYYWRACDGTSRAPHWA